MKKIIGLLIAFNLAGCQSVTSQRDDNNLEQKQQNKIVQNSKSEPKPEPMDPNLPLDVSNKIPALNHSSIGVWRITKSIVSIYEQFENTPTVIPCFNDGSGSMQYSAQTTNGSIQFSQCEQVNSNNSDSYFLNGAMSGQLTNDESHFTAQSFKINNGYVDVLFDINKLIINKLENGYSLEFDIDVILLFDKYSSFAGKYQLVSASKIILNEDGGVQSGIWMYQGANNSEKVSEVADGKFVRY